MLTPDQLKDLLHSNGLSRKDRLLLILAVECVRPKHVEAIKSIGRKAGLREIEKWNVSDVLASCGGMAIRTDEGWQLNAVGREHVRSLAVLAEVNLVVTTSSQSLRKQLSSITALQTVRFVEEAIVCFEAKQYRAAVVFSWVGAVSVLYEAVVSRCLPPFNAEARRRDGNWRFAKSADDLSRMKEHDFLDLAEFVGVIGKNVKQVLQNHCLQLRNACGHPNSLLIAENSVAAHIEKLILNVYSKF